MELRISAKLSNLTSPNANRSGRQPHSGSKIPLSAGGAAQRRTGGVLSPPSSRPSAENNNENSGESSESPDRDRMMLQGVNRGEQQSRSTGVNSRAPNKGLIQNVGSSLEQRVKAMQKEERKNATITEENEYDEEDVDTHF